MPRLNYGTLLENIVVLEATRLCLERSVGEGPLTFASAFELPPLTQCWSKPPSQPAFNEHFLTHLAATPQPPQTLFQLWSLCLNNSPRLLVCRYSGAGPEVARHFPNGGGPNGALLASMLATQQERAMRLWVNDPAAPAGRYGEEPPAAPNSPTESAQTLSHAGALVGMAGSGSVEYVDGLFPATVPNLERWLARGDAGTVRIGFLDPDVYGSASGDNAPVLPNDHQHWLRALAIGSQRVLSITFSGLRNRGEANRLWYRRLAMFHADELVLYPRSFVFEHNGFLTGVKIRWPESSINDVRTALQAAIITAWNEWSLDEHRNLLSHADGCPATV